MRVDGKTTIDTHTREQMWWRSFKCQRTICLWQSLKKEGEETTYKYLIQPAAELASLLIIILLQVGVLMHESDFNYNQTQQVARERQRVELSSEGLYDIQVLSVTLNTTELTLDDPPLSFIVEWGGRQSDTFTFQELREDTSKINY